MTIQTLASQFLELKKKSDFLSEELKKTNAEWEEVEKELLNAMVEEGTSSIRLEGMGLFSMRTRSFLSVNAANKPNFYEYLKESGNGDLLKLDVNPRTLTAFLKGHQETLESQYLNEGLDPVDARKKALEFLNQKGASYFSERGVSFKGDK